MRYIGDKSDITLPATIDGVAMLHISPNAFAGTAVQRVVIPEGYDCIQSRSFADCANLTEIHIPDSVFLISNNAFSHSPNVTIVCSEGSFAHSFALSRGIPVRLV